MLSSKIINGKYKTLLDDNSTLVEKLEEMNDDEIFTLRWLGTSSETPLATKFTYIAKICTKIW